MVNVERDGSLAFRVFIPEAERVELVGSFTEWMQSPVAMEKERCGPGGSDCTGYWCARVRAPDGDHQFSYFVDGQWWLPDYAAHGVKRNEFGNWTSILFVPPPPRMVERMGRRKGEVAGVAEE